MSSLKLSHLRLCPAMMVMYSRLSLSSVSMTALVPVTSPGQFTYLLSPKPKLRVRFLHFHLASSSAVNRVSSQCIKKTNIPGSAAAPQFTVQHQNNENFVQWKSYALDSSFERASRNKIYFLEHLDNCLKTQSALNSKISDSPLQNLAGQFVLKRYFSTTGSCFGRKESTSFKTLSPISEDTVQGSKRNVGRSSRFNDSSNISFNLERCKVREKTRAKFRRVLNFQTKLSFQNKKLREELTAHRVKGALAVHRLRRKFKVKKEDVKTIPNLLTTLRMASAPVLAYLVVHDSFGLALSIFVLAGITDMLDGYIARNFKNQRTALGTALDPLADKFLVSFLTISLTSAGLIPVPLTVLIVSRDVGLILASFYIRYISLSPPRTVARYFDVSHVTAKLYPSTISKVNTGLQLSYVAMTLAAPVFDFVDNPWLQALMYTTAVTTFLSGADYLLTWRRRLKIINNK